MKHVTIDGKMLPPTESEVRIQIATDRIEGQYLLVVLTNEGIIIDLCDNVSGESDGTSSEMYEEIADRLESDQ